MASRSGMRSPRRLKKQPENEGLKKIEKQLTRMGLDLIARTEVLELVQKKLDKLAEGRASPKKLTASSEAVVETAKKSVPPRPQRPDRPKRPVRRSADSPQPARMSSVPAKPSLKPSPASLSSPNLSLKLSGTTQKYAEPEYTIISPRASEEVLDDLLKQCNALYRSETEYIRTLDYIIKLYLEPLRKQPKSTELVVALFSNVEIISQIHKQFHVALRVIVDLWPNGEHVGVALDRAVGSMRVYEQYVTNFCKAIDYLEKERERSKAFCQLLERGEDEFPVSLHALLSVPLNRIPQLRSLVDQMLNTIPRNTIRYQALSKAVSSLTQLQECLSECADSAKDQREVTLISQSIFGVEGPPLVEVYRRFIKGGQVIFRAPDGKQELCQLFLFNDILVSTKLKDARGLYKYKATFPLQYSTLSGGDGDVYFTVTDSRLALEWTMGATDMEDKRHWMTALRTATNEMQATVLFGSSLRRAVQREMPGQYVPSYIQMLFLHIEKNASSKNIFKTDKIDISKKRNLINRGRYPEVSALAPEEAAALIVDFVRLLRHPVIPYELYDEFVAALISENQMKSLIELVGKMPDINQNFMKQLMRTLNIVSQNSLENKASVALIADRIGPYLARQRPNDEESPREVDPKVVEKMRAYTPLVQLLICNYSVIFPADPPKRFARACPLSVSASPHLAKSSTITGSVVLGGRRLA